MSTNNTKTINFLADIIAPLGIVLVTVALFLIFMPENPWTLFWFNIIYTSVLEIILFAYIVWLPRRGGSVVLKWMCGTSCIVYICIAVIWMLLFALVLCYWCPLKLYFSVLAGLTTLWIFIGATTVKVDNIGETSRSVLDNSRRKVDNVINKAEMLLEQFNLLKTTHSELTQASLSVTLLCRGLSTLSPTAMTDENTVKRIQSIISGLEDLLDESIFDLSVSRLKEYADRSLITLNGIKKSIRK